MKVFSPVFRAFAILLLCAVAQAAAAQQADGPAPAGDETPFLKVYFGSGSSQIAGDQTAALDQAARTFRAGDPFVMIVAGGADTVGAAAANLSLSLRRANAVADELVARGIPVERLQVLGRGNSELEVPTPRGVPEEQNRIVEISWR